MSGLLTAVLTLGVLGLEPPEPTSDDLIQIVVPLSKTGELDLAEFVARIANATGLDLQRPPGDLTLTLNGLAGTLSRKMLAATLGDDVKIRVDGQSLVIEVDRQLASDVRRPEWTRRIGELAAKCDAETKRRLQYGMHALKSYRPNDSSRPTVCLVHGVNSSSYGFVHMIPPLVEAGYGIIVYDFPYNRSLEESCRKFAKDWLAFRREMGETKPWAIVGHSMGALLARDYVESDSYARDVNTLIMIAPVNQGSQLAQTQTVLQLFKGLDALNNRRTSDALAHLGDGLGAAASDMVPGSRFLNALNARARREGVAYHIIAGDSGILPARARRQIEDQAKLAKSQSGILGVIARKALGEDLSDRLDEVSDGAGDGCVSVARTKLSGVSDHVVIHANHAELIRAPLLFKDPGPVACMPYLLRWLPRPVTPEKAAQEQGDRR